MVGLLAIGGMPAAAQDESIQPLPDVGIEELGQGEDSQLDALFATLRSTADAAAAKSAENDIIRLWLESGSDTTDLLMEWTLSAMEKKNYPLALDYLDRIISLQPDYVEGWNKRATVHFLIDDYGKAIADIERTLALEPRHFGALSGLGTIMRDIGDNDRAVVAYRQALEIDPYLETVREALDEIAAEDSGRKI